MNAYEKIHQLEKYGTITEDCYNQLLVDFPAEWLVSINYEEDLLLHRKQLAYKNEVLRLLEIPLREIQYRPEMAHIEPKERNYVPAKVADVWDRDNRLASEYHAIIKYCEQTKKDPNIILVHMAEYRGLQKLYDSIRAETINSAITSEIKPMPKNFEIEKRETYGKEYLKVFLRGGLDHNSVAKHLATLHSVSRANVTEQKSGKIDITVYPAKAYDISEVEQEIELTLTNYFKGSSVDPSFVTETISSISDKAYFQVIDYILRLGKNLEAFKELNTKFDEERYRDYFIPFLNAISESHAAKAEVFNKKGKTDILLFDNDGNNIFIAECKLWNGESYLIDAIDQLLNSYVNWRDEKTALIIFNRDNKKFSDVLAKAVASVTNHKLCLKALGKRAETSYSFLFRHPDDEKRTIKLELVLFNFA